MIKSKHPRDLLYIDKDLDWVSGKEEKLYDKYELEYQDYEDIDTYQCECKNKYSSSSIKKKKKSKRSYQKWNRLQYSMFKKYYKRFAGKNYEDLHSWMSSLFKGEYNVKFDEWYLSKDVYEEDGKIYYKTGRWRYGRAELTSVHMYSMINFAIKNANDINIHQRRFLM